MSTSRLAFLVLPAALLLALPGCDDPNKDKSKATVQSAAPLGNGKPTSSASPTSAAADYYPIDAAASKIGFVGSKAIGNHPGTFGKFSGLLGVGPGNKAEGGKVKVEIEVASVKTDDPKLDGHLQAPDFFDVAKFPKATFDSVEIKAGGEKDATHTVTGIFELRGVKKTISFPAKITVTSDGITALAEFTINRKDFGIVYAGMADNLIKDDVAISLAIKTGKKGG